MSNKSIHAARLPLEELLRDCEIRRGRRSGPGGQHRNKVETAIVITHKPTGVRAEATERRSQEQNRLVALFRLRVNLALELRMQVPRDSRPSDLWQSRCPRGRVSINATHDDFPAMLAEALDIVTAHEMDVRLACEALNCTASQLVKLLKLEPRALTRVNYERRERGLSLLR